MWFGFALIGCFFCSRWLLCTNGIRFGFRLPGFWWVSCGTAHVVHHTRSRACECYVIEAFRQLWYERMSATFLKWSTCLQIQSRGCKPFCGCSVGSVNVCSRHFETGFVVNASTTTLLPRLTCISNGCCRNPADGLRCHAGEDRALRPLPGVPNRTKSFCICTVVHICFVLRHPCVASPLAWPVLSRTLTVGFLQRVAFCYHLVPS